MEASQGDVTVVRYLYRRGLEANPRSRFTYLSWALFEKQQGSLENARALLKQGHLLNPREAPILQVTAKDVFLGLGCCASEARMSVQTSFSCMLLLCLQHRPGLTHTGLPVADALASSCCMHSVCQPSVYQL